MELKALKQFVASHDNFEIRVITHSGSRFYQVEPHLHATMRRVNNRGAMRHSLALLVSVQDCMPLGKPGQPFQQGVSRVPACC